MDDEVSSTRAACGTLRVLQVDDHQARRSLTAGDKLKPDTTRCSGSRSRPGMRLEPRPGQETWVGVPARSSSHCSPQAPSVRDAPQVRPASGVIRHPRRVLGRVDDAAARSCEAAE